MQYVRLCYLYIIAFERRKMKTIEFDFCNARVGIYIIYHKLQTIFNSPEKRDSQSAIYRYGL